VSSDSEKLRCLKILAEVEQYIHQDKRKPAEVAEILQSIIDSSIPINTLSPNLLGRSSRGRIVSAIRRETEAGLIIWIYAQKHRTYTDWKIPYPYDTAYAIIKDKPAYEISIKLGFERKHQNNVESPGSWEYTELQVNGFPYSGYLSCEERVFFYEVLRKAKERSKIIKNDG